MVSNFQKVMDFYTDVPTNTLKFQIDLKLGSIQFAMILIYIIEMKGGPNLLDPHGKNQKSQLPPFQTILELSPHNYLINNGLCTNYVIFFWDAVNTPPLCHTCVIK